MVLGINRKLQHFQEAWNSHIIRTEGKTPRQMWISGMLSNKNSGYTATTEVFNNQDDLYQRILGAFNIDNSDLNVLNLADDESNMSYEFEFNENIQNEIQSIMDRDIEDKQKFINILSCLNAMND